MEIRNNNNYQQSPAFKRIIVPKESQKRFMRALRAECSPTELLEVLHVFEKEAKNTKNNIRIKDIGYLFGTPCNGHWEATVAGCTYNNCNINLQSIFKGLPSAPKFLKKLSDKAGEGLDKTQKTIRTKIDELAKKELAKKKLIFKDGGVVDGERKGFLCGEIYKLMTQFSK